ncbi:hypothetical protein [Neorhizobium galegae]|uniref:hypothetical protein n=1 Tax=Neorhizobium galegae TaxID=399 RepID=UPI0006220260|nr:hypothetical protein [Neorhizobium galegae]KAB1120740.1 hypothetical protein F4V90_28570 [Neorhizobium galegae]MCQ1810057.1 hypothetical protein [Neorhizobium galegae]CDZ62659.1 Hypothetical protein NGAL_HAMBI2566_51770 [Neorhizobium galegae bv. orientalis]
MLWDYDFRLISRLPCTADAAARHKGNAVRHLRQPSLDSLRKSFKQLREREDTHMRACEFHIAALALPAIQAAQRACFAAFSKTKAKTTTKTV